MLRAPFHPGLSGFLARWILLLLAGLLAPAHARQTAPPAPPRTDLPTLTRIRDVIDLGIEGARRNPHPVRVRGVITYVVPSTARWIYVQDDTGGTLVIYDEAQGTVTEGAEVEVEGQAGVGEFHSYIQNARLRVLGTRPLPEPARPDPERLAQGDLFGHWVRLHAVVRNIVRTRTTAYILATHRNRNFFIHLLEEGDNLRADWIDAEIEVDGLVWTETDAASRPIGFRLHVPNARHLRLLRPGKPDPFDQPVTGAAELRSRATGGDTRIRVLGIVSAIDGLGGTLHLHTDAGPVKVQLLASLSRRVFANHPARRDPTFREARTAPDVFPVPGDVVDVVGALWPDPPYAPRLTGAEYRIVGRDTSSQATKLRPAEALQPGNDGRLVTVRARFVDRTASSAGRTNILQLWLQDDSQIFEARLESDRPLAFSVPDGSLVEATGVAVPVLGELRRPRGLRLVLRDVSDVVAVQDPFSWLTPRVRNVFGAVAALAAAAVIWIGLLHRVVKRQTAEIKASEARLRQSEHRFRTVFRSSPAMMILTRLEDSVFVAVNDAFLQATGYSESEVTGRPVTAVNIYADPNQRTEFLEIIRRDGSVRDREHLVRRKDGSTFTALVTGEIVEIDGRLHTLAVGLDITDRKKAEEDTLRALQAERDLGELKSRFVSLVSHEFRTPLGITMSAVELLRNYFDRLPAPKRAELLDDIFSATLRMSSLMEQVLLLGRVESGKVSFKPAPADLPGLAARLVDEVAAATQERCPVRVEHDGGLDGAEIDEGLVRPILSNLLANAVKYSEAGSEVRLAIRREGPDALIDVIDSGIGIPEADQPRLFEAFHRASNVEHVPGTGLGLLIVKHCVDLHQGSIRFESRLGAGTRFTVRIPAFRV